MMLDSILHNLLWTEGQQLVVVLVMLAFCAIIVRRPLLIGFVPFLFIATFYFFRNPERLCIPALHDDTVLVCPADGKIIDIQYGGDVQENGKYAQKVSIFLSLFDVHVNWIPTAGIVEHITYKPGAFSFAFLSKSSTVNECNDLVIRRPDNYTVKIRQIAGILARRICCWVEQDQMVTTGQKYGMIRFGSRIDIFLPAAVQLKVGIGQHVYGGQTVLGQWTI